MTSAGTPGTETLLQPLYSRHFQDIDSALSSKTRCVSAMSRPSYTPRLCRSKCVQDSRPSSAHRTRTPAHSAGMWAVIVCKKSATRAARRRQRAWREYPPGAVPTTTAPSKFLSMLLQRVRSERGIRYTWSRTCTALTFTPIGVYTGADWHWHMPRLRRGCQSPVWAQSVEGEACIV